MTLVTTKISSIFITEKEVVMEQEEECEDCLRPLESCKCCECCQSYPCICCPECGYVEYECRCCSECGVYGCSCANLNGTSNEAPWVARGVKVPHPRYSDWTQAWPDIDQGIDPLALACDFYVLEALVNHAWIDLKPSSDSLTKSEQNNLLDLLGINDPKQRKIFLADRPSDEYAELLAEAKAMQEALVEKLDPIFVSYCHMAVAGEARHHRAIGGQFLNSERDVAWAEWRDVFEAVGNRALMDLYDLFLEFDDNGYGGAAWADAARILYDRLERNLGPTVYLNKKVFVDRVFSLQHNGGQLLNKIDWEIVNAKKANVDYMNRALARHASDPPDILFLYRMGTFSQQELTRKIVRVAKLRGAQLRPEFEMDMSQLETELVKQPIVLCRICNSNAELGHSYECDAPKFVRRNGSKFENNYLQRIWDESQLPADCLYPKTPEGKGAIPSDTKVHVSIGDVLIRAGGPFYTTLRVPQANIKTVQLTMNELSQPINITRFVENWTTDGEMDFIENIQCDIFMQPENFKPHKFRISMWGVGQKFDRAVLDALEFHKQYVLDKP